MIVGVTIKGGEKLKAAFDSVDSAARVMFIQGLRQAALRIHEIAVKSIAEHQSSGKRYGNHVASLPGFPPNTDTGALVKALDVQIDQSALIAAVGLNPSKAKPGRPGAENPMEYGPDLEFGTSRVAARPYLGPAYRKVRPDIVKYFKLKVKKG